jgi:hypothetical protein
VKLLKKGDRSIFIFATIIILVFIFHIDNYSHSAGFSQKDFLVQPDTNWAPYKEKVEVKGIYLTGNTVGYKDRFDELIRFIDATEINAVVIDIKDDLGEITYNTDLEYLKDIGATNNIRIEDIDEVMDILREKDIYPIARIVTFKDRNLASKRPDLAIKSKDGTVWRDNKGDAWLNPYNKKSWEYPIKIAEEAALKGFKEIQFDYVRFPTDGKRDFIDYGQAIKDTTMEKAIGEFLKYARERLEPLGVYVSADVFGLVTTAEDDMGLGQYLETIATSVDIVSPMVYPSHYAMGSYGVKYPDAEPYKIVYKSVATAVNRIDNIHADDRKAIIRPWLQDFSAPWLKKQYGSHYIKYGEKQIKAQIQACYDSGIREWIFWNASNKYTINGYKRK